MNDNKIRNEYVKILKSAPSRGGQEAPSWVIDEARTANIKTIKRKVDAFRRRESKLKKTGENTKERSTKELQKTFIKLSMKHKGKSCYKEYGGKLVCSKVPKSNFDFELKRFYNTRKSLIRAVAGLEILDAKVNKKKSKKNKKTKK